MKVGHVPLIPYGRPGSPAVADQVAESITAYGQSGRILRAVMLARLGPNVWHDSPSAAMGVLEELEETAKLISITGSPIPELAGPDIEELRKTFGAYW
jgi:ribulose-5-phosphate 4-epimerase/fuculose-1-phosphate aldolase